MRLRAMVLGVVLAFIGVGYFINGCVWGEVPSVKVTAPPTGTPSTPQATVPRYQFKATTAPIYEISIKADTPSAVETQSGHIFYTINSVDPANGQIDFGYSTSCASTSSRNCRQKIMAGHRGRRCHRFRWDRDSLHCPGRQCRISLSTRWAT